MLDLFQPPKVQHKRGRIVRLLDAWGIADPEFRVIAPAQERAREDFEAKRGKSEAKKARARDWHQQQYANDEAFREAARERARRTYERMTLEQRREKMARAKARKAGNA